MEDVLGNAFRLVGITLNKKELKMFVKIYEAVKADQKSVTLKDIMKIQFEVENETAF